MNAPSVAPPRPVEARIEGFLDGSAGNRSQASRPRDRSSEIVVLVVFVIGSALLLVHGPLNVEEPLLLALLTFAFALASRISFPIEETSAIPTQVLLLPLLMLGPPALTPLLVFVALAAARTTAAGASA